MKSQIKLSWNVILNTIVDHNVVPPVNNPASSGEYLCTCVVGLDSKVAHRYLRVMSYDAEHNCWHDPGFKYGVSATILAWADVPVCDFADVTLDHGLCLPREERPGGDHR